MRSCRYIVVIRSNCYKPVNPGVEAAIFLERPSLSRLGSSLIGRRWTLKMDALPLMSGGPDRRQERILPLHSN